MIGINIIRNDSSDIYEICNNIFIDYLINIIHYINICILKYKIIVLEFNLHPKQ